MHRVIEITLNGLHRRGERDPGFTVGKSTNQCVAGGVMEMKQVPGVPEATAMDLV